MTFLSSFEVVRYRGLDGVSFPRLARANLVTGVNGIGKTAALEAMWLFTGRYNTPLLWNANLQRENKPVLDPIGNLTNGSLELKGVENGTLHSMKTTYQKIAEVEVTESLPNLPSAERAFLGPPVVGRILTELDGRASAKEFTGFQVTPRGTVVYQTPEQSIARPGCIILSTRHLHESPNEYLERYSDMVRQNRKEDLKRAINLILPRVEDVEILTNETGQSYFSAVTTGGVQLPIHDLGGGVVRLYQLFLSYFASREGMLFADEIENGFHYSVLREIWSRSREWMGQWDVQIVATTHSDECIAAAMVAFEDTPSDLAIHNLFLNEESGKIEVITFTGDSLEGARDLNLETR